MRLSRGACLKGALLGIVTFGLLYKGALLTEAGVRDNTADAAKGERDEDGNGSDFVGTPDDMRVRRTTKSRCQKCSLYRPVGLSAPAPCCKGCTRAS